MNIKYRQLKAFVLVARLGSFAAAADTLAITPPSFSVLIKELERDVGVMLFERTTRHCQLTQAGQIFYEQIHASLGHIEDAYANLVEVSRGQQGWLRLASLTSLSSGLVNRTLGKYRRRYPNVEVRLSECTNEGVYEAVRNKKAEIGVCSDVHPDPDLVFLPLYTDQLVAVMPVDHELAVAKDPVRWKVLEEYPYVLLRSGTAEHALRLCTLNIKPSFEVDNVTTAIAMVRNGTGITVVLSRTIRELNMEGLAWRPIHGPLSERKLGVVYHRKASPRKAAEIFIDMLRTDSVIN